MKHIIKHFFSKKRNIWIAGIVLVVGIGGFFLFSRGGGTNTATQTGVVERKDIQETVLVTGQVVSGTDLDLSFPGSGVVRGIKVKEGDKVYAGQVLAYLDQAFAQASLTTAKGSLAQAQANYDKLLAGATTGNIKTYENAVTSAKQDLSNAYNGAINTLKSVYISVFNAYSVVYNIHYSYFLFSDQQGIAVSSAKNDINTSMQKVKLLIDGAGEFPSSQIIDSLIPPIAAELSTVYNGLTVARMQCDIGEYYQRVSLTDKSLLDSQKSLVNTTSTNLANLGHSIASLKVALKKSEDQLALVKDPPTLAEINLAKAQILSAQGQVDSAQAQLNNVYIISPSNGVVTEIKVKAGEQASSLGAVITLQDVGDLHTEADVSEANIASLQLGQVIDYTFDALGPDKYFSGTILTINPSSTVVSGVVNYKMKGSLENISDVKPGMTVNMTIKVAQKNDVLAVPSSAVINKNNTNYVRVIKDEKKLTYDEVQVTLGLQADEGLIEIVSGLSEGQKIITYTK